MKRVARTSMGKACEIYRQSRTQRVLMQKCLFKMRCSLDTLKRLLRISQVLPSVQTAANYIVSDLLGLMKKDSAIVFPKPALFAELIDMPRKRPASTTAVVCRHRCQAPGWCVRRRTAGCWAVAPRLPEILAVDVVDAGRRRARRETTRGDAVAGGVYHRC